MTHAYSMLIQWSEEDEAYVVSLPEFQDCRTHGASYEEAAKNGEEALALIVESYRAHGWDLPRAATLQTADGGS